MIFNKTKLPHALLCYKHFFKSVYFEVTYLFLVFNMRKSNAEKCKHYYMRNQAEKRKKIAERVRDQRQCQKIISENQK